MSEIISSQIQQTKTELPKKIIKNVSEERAFSHMILKIFYKQNYSDHQVTDGKDDGGIDFVYFDEEESKVILGQSKFTSTLIPNDIVGEFQKMKSTVDNFRIHNTGIYNSTLQNALQNALDSLSEENIDNIEYCLFTTSNIDKKTAFDSLENKLQSFPSQAAVIYDILDIEEAIQKTQEQIDTVKEFSLEIDKAKNYLEYHSKQSSGIICNLSSHSLIKLFNKYSTNGLFNLNIRRYIRNAMVDNGINSTLEKDRDNFWFLNNGIMIACKNYYPDGNTIKIYDFSIVNGGQTTTLIGKYKGSNHDKFFIPCKIVATKDKNNAPSFFTNIAEATNSQKPIYPRDLKSNAPEMVRLSNWLKNEKIYLEIKRGLKPDFKPNFSLKNDELGQLLLSFIYQRPGTSRSGKRTIFSNASVYNQLFKTNYQKDRDKKQFLLDLIDLKKRYDEIEERLKKRESEVLNLNENQIEILKNGRQTIFAVMGMYYRVINDFIRIEDFSSEGIELANLEYFNYGSILSHYKADDIDEKLERIVYNIVNILEQIYSKEFKDKKVSSVSNFMKTDQKYYRDIIVLFPNYHAYSEGRDLLKSVLIFKQSNV